MPADRLNVTEEDGLMMEALAASFQEHEFSCRVYPHENESGHLRLKYGVDPNHFQGRRLSLRGTGRNQPEAIVFLQDSAKPVAVVPITTDQMVIRLLTSIGQDNEFESRIDARHHMALRLRLEALSLARRRDWIEFGEESEFLELHEAEYSEEALVGMGLSELTTQERDIDEVAYFESVIAWRGDRRSFESMTRGISDRIRLKHRMPWIKGLLMCAFTILCVLGWFKVDWWLKGNYSLLSALGFVLVFCVSLGLIWSFRYDALI
jgi:hypothetical protein